MTGRHVLKQCRFGGAGFQRCTIRAIAVYLIGFSAVAAIASLFSGLALTAVQAAFFFLVGAAAVYACLWASKHSSTHKRFWQLITIGIISWYCARLISIYYAIQLGPQNVISPNISDIFSIAYVPVIVGILISVGKINRPFDAIKKQILVDIMLVGSAIFLIYFEMIVMPMWHSGVPENRWGQLLDAVYSVFDWIILIGLVSASYRVIEKKKNSWLLFMTVAFAFNIFADIAEKYVGYEICTAVIIFNSMGAMMVILSAINEVKGSQDKIVQRLRNNINTHLKESKQSNLYRTIILPSVTAFCVPLAWVIAFYPELNHELIMLAVASAMIIGLLIYRNHLVVSENAVLFLKTLRDSLTGLHNHRYFQEALTRMIHKAQKTDKAVSLMLIDIDNFSKFNNKYGHMVGDRVLTMVAETLMSTVRDTDETCRLSGDEFAVILPRTDGDEALKAAGVVFKRMMKRLADELPGMHVSVSIGISSCPSLSSTKDELLATADGALYWVKLDGGSDILLYNPNVVEVMNAEERSKKMEEIASLDMVRSLARAVDARDPYTRLHSTRVGYLARRVAERMGMDERSINKVEVAGILHDVGKIGISDAILNKPEKLDVDEITAIKTHPVLSARIIGSTSLKEIIPYVRSHHEHWDGNGYPDGLKGEEIPLIARILAVADAFDAMSSDRPYRKSLGIGKALMELKRCSGTQFDPVIVEHMLAMYGINNHNVLFENDHDNDVFPSIASSF